MKHQTFDASFFRNGPQLLVLILIPILMMGFFFLPLMVMGEGAEMSIGVILGGIAIAAGLTFYLYFKLTIIPCQVIVTDSSIAIKLLKVSFFYAHDFIEVKWKDMKNLHLRQSPENSRYFIVVEPNPPAKKYNLALKSESGKDKISPLWLAIKEKYAAKGN